MENIPSIECRDISDVSIVVLSYNRRDTLERNLAALVQLADEENCELILVDNASTDGSAEMITNAIEGQRNARFIANISNLGVARGRNTGWREARRKYILNIDDDITVSVDNIQRMAAILREEHGIGIVAPKIIEYNTGVMQYGYGERRLEIANFQGACHMIRRDLAVQLGFNDEGCSFGGEEIDLSIRVRAAGFNVIFTPETTVIHDHKIRHGQEAKSRREQWVYNFTRIFFKNFSVGAALPFSLRYLLSHLVSGMRAYGPSFAVTLVKAAARGFRDGRQQHQAVPDDVARFYSQPDLRPEFGNMPIWRKVVRKSSGK